MNNLPVYRQCCRPKTPLYLEIIQCIAAIPLAACLFLCLKIIDLLYPVILRLFFRRMGDGGWHLYF